MIGAAAWRVTWGATSPALYLLGFTRSVAGNLQQLAVVPWVQEGGTAPSAVSWTIAGSNFGAVLSALLGTIQKTGAPDQRFSVSAFFVFFLFLILLVRIAGMASDQMTPHKVVLLVIVVSLAGGNTTT